MNESWDDMQVELKRIFTRGINREFAAPAVAKDYWCTKCYREWESIVNMDLDSDEFIPFLVLCDQCLTLEKIVEGAKL